MNTKRAICFLLALGAAGFLAAGSGWAQSGSKLDPEAAKFYRAARLIMSSEEDKIFKHLPDAESRKEFIQDFWDKRNPDPAGGDNQFKTEFEARVDYANRHFKEGGLGMNTDRGRVYIFLGPADKTEDFINRAVSTTARGSRIWWIYYKYGVGVEFVDEKGYGAYKINQIEGNLFEAMDLYKLGQWVDPDSVFKQAVVDFKLTYDDAKKELVVFIPAKFLRLRETSEGQLQVDLEFKFYVYEDEGARREVFVENRSYVTADMEYEKSGDIPFRFAHPLKPGKDFIDVSIKGREGSQGKVRNIFNIKVGR